MNHSPSDDLRSRVEQLAAKMLDGNLSAAEQAELLRSIEQDAAACDQFVGQVALHAVLREEVGAFRPEALSGELFSVSPEELPELTAGMPSCLVIPDVAPAQPIPDHRPILTSLRDVFVRGTGAMSRAAAALVLVGTLCAGVLLGALAVAAAPQWNGDGARPSRDNSEVTLLGSTGSGFTTALYHGTKLATTAESDTPATPAIAPRDYVQTVSNDTLSLFGAVPKRTVWQLRFTGGLLDDYPGNRRVVLGLRSGATPAANLFLPGAGDAAQAGLWVFVTNGINRHPYTIQLGKHGNLVFVNDAGEAILLAKWDWAKFDMSTNANITVSLDTSSTHYALSFDQEIKDLTGSLSGTLPSAAPVSVRVGVFDQIGDGDVPGSVIVDRIAISNLPASDFDRFDRGDANVSGANREKTD